MRIDWVRELTSAGLRKRVQQKHTDAVNPSAPASPQPKQSSTSPSKTDQLALVSDSEKSVIKHEEKDGPKLQDQDQGCYISDVTFERLRRFTETAYRSYILGRPTADHLLTLSKVNVFRAFEMIIGLMGMSPSPDWMHDDALSPFTTQGPGVAEENTLPPSLRPTKLQKTLSHHPWLDFFPIPKIRDNLLRAESCSMTKLCVWISWGSGIQLPTALIVVCWCGGSPPIRRAGRLRRSSCGSGRGSLGGVQRFCSRRIIGADRGGRRCCFGMYSRLV